MNESEHTRKKIMPVIRERGGWCTKKVAGPGSAVGMPDVVGSYRGRCLGVEVKLPGGSWKVTEKQQDTLDQMELAGATVGVVRTPQDMHDLLDRIDAEADDDGG